MAHLVKSRRKSTFSVSANPHKHKRLKLLRKSENSIDLATTAAPESSAHYILLVFASFALAACYSLGITGGWHFDDSPNLWALQYVDTPLEVLHYAFSGEAGPTGRPLSLLSFALQSQSYPSSPESFLRVNIALHVLNFILVYFFLARLTGMLWPGCYANRWLALTAAFLWAFCPLMTGTTLMAVQRMTLLSATFVLAGLYLFLKGYEVSTANPTRGAALTVSGLVGGTVLATLAKENGALLPVFAICIHYLLLQPSGWDLEPKWRKFNQLIMWVPVAFIVAYLTWIGFTQSGYAHRDFTLWERLLTQSRVLWDYVFSLLVPKAGVATPFSDNYRLSTGLLSPLTTFSSVLGWTFVVTLTIVLRRWSIIPLFGLCWFLSGHLLESTTVALELYFAHRNYVPSIGIWLFIVWLAFRGMPSQSLQKWARSATVIYAALMALVLFNAVSLWGNPGLASKMWFMQNEDSLRAAQFNANTHARDNDTLVADHIMQTAQQHHPDNIQIDLQRLSYCTGSERDYRRNYQQLHERIKLQPEIELAGMAGLGYLAQLAIAGHCAFLQPEDVRRLVETSSPQTNVPRITRLTTRQRLTTLARLDLHAGREKRAVERYVQALQTDPNPFLLKSVGTFLIAAGLSSELDKHSEELSMVEVTRPFGQTLWNRTLNELINSQAQQ